MTYRVIQWTTGNVGRYSLRQILDHPELELAGVYVTSDAKRGRDAGELSEKEFAEIETDLLARIREIKERQGGTGALAFGGGNPIEAAPGSRFEVEATVEGDWERPPRTTRTARTTRTRLRPKASARQAKR